MKRLIPLIAFLLLWPLTAVSGSSELEEVVVTATRSEKVMLINPYTVDVVTAGDIALSGADQLAELVRKLPGVLVTDAGQAGQKRLRLRGEEARRVALLIDNQEFVDHREVGVPLLVDVSRIDRIEVVRSPASVLYGPRAMGGVINVITRRNAERPFELDLKSTWNGATDGYTLGMQLAGATEAGFGWSVGGSRNRQDLRDTPVGEIDRTEYENSAFNGSISYGRGDHEFSLGYEQFESSSEVYVEPEVRFKPPFRDFVIDAPVRDREKLRFDYQYTPTGRWLQSVRLDGYRQNSDREFNTFPSMVLFPGVDLDIAIFTTSELESDGFNLQTDWLTGERYSLITGLQWVEDSVSQNRLREAETNGFLTSSETQLDKASIGSLAWYAQLEFELGDLMLLPGLRTYRVDGKMDASNHFGSLSDFDDSHTVSSLAMVWSPTPSSAARLSYAEGYIYPSLFNLVVGAYAGSRFINPQTSLEPETSETWELGYRHGGENWSADLVLFQTRAENYIDHLSCRTIDNCPGRRDEIYRNVGESRSHGLEAKLSYEMKGIEIDASLTWLRRHKEYDGVSTWDSGVPAISGYISLGYGSMLANRPLTSRLITRFESEADELVGTEIEQNPGYGVVDLEFHYQWHRTTSVSVAGGNLADKKYHSATENLWAPGRHLRVRLGVSL